ncbi:hypothetical protein [Methanosarcina mazei]|uniref:Uncharacterized protein n=6 Tax=Methanosarcina mazei TaxID=2209 RepID=A0A0F8E5S6_METMZ|nr:hypothetical protein [Methanosarcina mazei]AAM31530.1 conserved protein [Methanosarcina mazei Go1]AGF97250.1 Hypothetical protein MmTuc01_1911 [Methanosarcina mazei Tuc01]AKB62696.1 hypothetical protein MSMAP_2711 [Methanosarcina mazei SarPi]AKB66043.1 hypothetical protein MSMAS_2847 [Methanosarcina mazei S-6]AKB71473.1 hypothetical protein MSMAC_1583 [Methanosarcina mazei C16]
MSGNIEEAGIRILPEGELISRVVEKHKKFLEEYRKEFEELDSKLSQFEEDAKNAKISRTRIAERKEVLKEKRQQFYHQVEGLLEKDLFPKLDPVTADKIKEDIKKLKGQIEPEEEQDLKNSFMKNLGELIKEKETGESLLQQVNARLDEAGSSNIELKEIKESEKQLEEDDGSKSSEISKSKPQHKWLSTKIKSHEEALSYWEKQKA